MNLPKVWPLNKISPIPPQRFLSGYVGFDQLMGGGIVKGSALLIAGTPGSGKSTALMQLAFNWATLANQKVLYIAGEENKEQIKMRAVRLGVDSSKILLYENTEVEAIIEKEEELKPDIIIVDSLQTLYSKTLKTQIGSPTQIRNGLFTLIGLAKSKQITIVFIGHSTKGGYIGGLQTYQHMVDVTLYLDIDDIDHSRTLVSKKNRFGSIDFVWELEMTENGLIDPEHPFVFTQPVAEGEPRPNGRESITTTSTNRNVNLTEDQVERIIADHPVWGFMVRASMNFLKKEVQKEL